MEDPQMEEEIEIPPLVSYINNSLVELEIIRNEKEKLPTQGNPTDRIEPTLFNIDQALQELDNIRAYDKQTELKENLNHDQKQKKFVEQKKKAKLSKGKK